MGEDKVIQYGKEWLEIVNQYRNSQFTSQETEDLGAGLIRMAYVRFEREYRAYWEDQMKLEEATRRIENEVAELLESI